MGDYDRDIQNAVAGVSAPAPSSDKITLKNGVVLKKKPFSVLIIQSVANKFKYPVIPEIYDEDRKRPIKNPDHPVFKAERDEIDAARGLAVIDAIIAFGTALDYTPETVESIDSTDWIDKCELIGIPVRSDNRNARYLAWVRNVAISDDSDLPVLMSLVSSAAGVSGEAVAQAIDSFPNNPKR